MADPPRLIEVRVHEIKQLFNSMDPSPFNERDLDRDADEYIVGWAYEYPLDAPVALRVHLEMWPQDDPNGVIRQAVHHYYDYRAGLAALEFRRVMRQGRTALIIGVVFLAACLLASHALAARGDSGVSGYVRESLTIAGWVAMWRPMETYLYDWWPIRRRQRVLKKLAAMAVEVVRQAPEPNA